MVQYRKCRIYNRRVIMIKKIISVLMTLAMMVGLVSVFPAITAGAEDYEYYLTQLQNKTSSKIIEFLYDDYDNDSEYEAFAVTCTNLPKDCYEGVICDIWFINSIGITKIKSNFIAELNEDYTVANILNSNGTKLITYNEWY